MQLAWRALVQRQVPTAPVCLASSAAFTQPHCSPPASKGTHTGDRSLHSSSAAAADAPSTSGRKGALSGLGSFLKTKLFQNSIVGDFFPGGVASTEESKKAEEEKQAPPKSETDKAMEQIDKMVNMSLEGYAEQCRVRNAQDAQGKQLRTPPVPMSHPDFKAFIDFHRVIYLRLKQHEEIISSMTREQIQLIEEKQHQVLQDVNLLSQIARQSLLPISLGGDTSSKAGIASSRGEYIPAEVRDCVKSWLELRRHGRFMQHWVSVRGKDPNASDDELERGKREYQEYEATELHSRMLAPRDVANCALIHVRGLGGRLTPCSLTGLPYMHCCGGKPLPVGIVRHMLNGRHYEDARARLEVELLQKGARIQTKQPYNHLAPKPERSPRQTSHDRMIRQALRTNLTPRFEKRTKAPFPST